MYTQIATVDIVPATGSPHITRCTCQSGSAAIGLTCFSRIGSRPLSVRGRVSRASWMSEFSRQLAHDLRDARTGDFTQEGYLGMVGDLAFPDQPVQAQGHHQQA